MKYAFFLGCTIPARELSYETSLRKVMERLGVGLVDLEGAICCAPAPIESIDFTTSLAIATYNICLAEDAGLDVLTVCNGCFQVLSRANAFLRARESLRLRINDILSEVGKEYKGLRRVRHYLQVLHDDLGLEKLRDKIFRPLKGLKVATFYGCHVLRPSSTNLFDDPESPTILDELVELTGARSISYSQKLKCCGGLLRGVDDDLAGKLAREKLFNISQAGAECIVTICPFCFLQLDIGQLEVNRRFNESFKIPVLHYPELLGLAMGMKAQQLGLGLHKIPVETALQL